MPSSNSFKARARKLHGNRAGRNDGDYAYDDNRPDDGREMLTPSHWTQDLAPKK